MYRKPVFRRSLAPLAGWLLLATMPLAAQVPADAVFQGFQPYGDLVFVLDDEVVADAEVYHSERAVAYLVKAPQLGSPLLVSPRTGAVERVSLMKVAKRSDGSIDLLADAAFDRVSSFKIEGEEVVFSVDGKPASLRPRPWLLGARSGEEVRSSNPDYGRGAEAYRPDKGAIEALRQEGRKVEVRIFFGSWCPFCKKHVPYLLKVAEALEGSKVSFEYYGLPRPFDGEAEAEKWKVRGVPTGIVLVDGKEVGRLTTKQWQQPEVALQQILSGA